MADSQKSLSSRRDEIFRPLEKPVFFLNDELWPDFYAILEVKRGVSQQELDDAIVEASSQLLAVNFARGMTARLRLVERFLTDFRVVLLDPKRRARYDTLLMRHQSRDPKAMPYATFFAGEWGESLVQRAKRRARTMSERLMAAWREAPYI